MASVLFDEGHSESWTIDPDLARQIQPDNWRNSSYSLAAEELQRCGFSVVRSTDPAFTEDHLQDADIVVLLHPCDPEWEMTTGRGTPRLTDQEITLLQEWVSSGGSLLVITEHENGKYNNNLNELLAPLEIEVANSTLTDPTHCRGDSPTWVLADLERSDAPQLTFGVRSACFYRAGGVLATQPAEAIYPYRTARPGGQALAVAQELGLGRVVVLAESDLFGDEHFDDDDHRALWRNVFHWLALPVTRRRTRGAQGAAGTPKLQQLLEATAALRTLQAGDGSVPASGHGAAGDLVRALVDGIGEVKGHFPHEASYWAAVEGDLRQWAGGGFGVPAFDRSVGEFTPQRWRTHGTELLCLFPQYTPNGSPEKRFELIHWKVVWPDWLERYNEREGGPRNAAFVPGQLLDHTDGYASECAVLFPSIVCQRGEAPSHFGTIFCSREARRFQAFASTGAEVARLQMGPDLVLLFEDLQLAQEAFALWDLIHDSSHFVGYLPLVPFLEGVPQPFWMGAVEELRVDLRSIEQAALLDGEGFRLARFVEYAVVLDRILRFPISGTRQKDFDGLAGQILFGKLLRADAVRWLDGQLKIDWAAVVAAARELRGEIDEIYRAGIVKDHVGLWTDLYRMVSKYVEPSSRSRWHGMLRASGSLGTDTADEAIAMQLDDEFPLGHFHEFLKDRVVARIRQNGWSW